MKGKMSRTVLCLAMLAAAVVAQAGREGEHRKITALAALLQDTHPKAVDICKNRYSRPGAPTIDVYNVASSLINFQARCFDLEKYQNEVEWQRRLHSEDRMLLRDKDIRAPFSLVGFPYELNPSMTAYFLVFDPLRGSDESLEGLMRTGAVVTESDFAKAVRQVQAAARKPELEKAKKRVKSLQESIYSRRIFGDWGS